MTSVDELPAFFEGFDRKVIIAADGETRSHVREGSRVVEQTPAGGVSVAFDVVCQLSDATYIARAKTDVDCEVVDASGKVHIANGHGAYTLKRLFLTPEEEDAYYGGFANQTLWPLCHAAFVRPTFRREWYEEYSNVNRRFAESIEEELEARNFVWINDYQLALVPGMLRRRGDTAVGLFWHIPWPTWEIFRILPQKREILESMLCCDYIAFHRRYQMRNFLNAVDHELGVRIDFETNTVYHNSNSVRIASLPMGIDVDIIREKLSGGDDRNGLMDAIRASFGMARPAQQDPPIPANGLGELCARYKILLGVDRLDYTKGIPERLMAIDQFLEENPAYREKVTYIGIMSPTRQTVPAYKELRERVEDLARSINDKYRTGDWEPLHMVYEGFTREDVVALYRRAAVCLVTPVDDGMNLVSKEFVVAAAESDDPGMLVLSQFAGSATDLSASVLVNPYDRDAVATGIKVALEMSPEERRERIDHMVSLLEERNVYEWAMSFVRNTVMAAREQQLETLEIA